MSIERTRKGSFQIRYTDNTGKRQTYKTIEQYQEAVIGGKRFVGRKLAEAIEDQLKVKLQNEDLGFVDSNLEIQPLVETYFRNCRGLRMDEDTLIVKEAAIKLFLSDMRSVTTLNDLSKKSLVEWRDKMFERRSAVGTIRTRLSQVRAFLTWLVENGYLKINPFGKKIMPPEQEGEPKFYTAQEFLDLDQASENQGRSLSLFVNICHAAGLRRNEAVLVRWEHIQFYPNGRAEFRLPKEICKGKKKGRVIPINVRLQKLLGSPPPGGSLIVGLGYRKVYSLFERARESSKINPDLDIHGLRHTFAKNYLQGGGNLKALRDLMGHMSVKTTEIYSQFEQSHYWEGIDNSYERQILEEGNGNGATFTIA